MVKSQVLFSFSLHWSKGYVHLTKREHLWHAYSVLDTFAQYHYTD